MLRGTVGGVHCSVSLFVLVALVRLITSITLRGLSHLWLFWTWATATEHGSGRPGPEQLSSLRSGLERWPALC